jgi:hypothetical protein
VTDRARGGTYPHARPARPHAPRAPRRPGLGWGDARYETNQIGKTSRIVVANDDGSAPRAVDRRALAPSDAAAGPADLARRYAGRRTGLEPPAVARSWCSPSPVARRASSSTRPRPGRRSLSRASAALVSGSPGRWTNERRHRPDRRLLPDRDLQGRVDRARRDRRQHAFACGAGPCVLAVVAHTNLACALDEVRSVRRRVVDGCFARRELKRPPTASALLRFVPSSHVVTDDDGYCSPRGSTRRVLLLANTGGDTSASRDLLCPERGNRPRGVDASVSRAALPSTD